MHDLATELTLFMTAYENANNSHDIDRVTPMIARDATYWFTDGSYHGQADHGGNHAHLRRDSRRDLRDQ